MLTSLILHAGEVRSRFEGGCSRVRKKEGCLAYSSCPRFRFREDIDGL